MTETEDEWMQRLKQLHKALYGLEMSPELQEKMRKLYRAMG